LAILRNLSEKWDSAASDAGFAGTTLLQQHAGAGIRQKLNAGSDHSASHLSWGQ